MYVITNNVQTFPLHKQDTVKYNLSLDLDINHSVAWAA